MNKVFRIFYSWQSSIGQHDNRSYIRNKIQSVISHSDYNLMIDEATRDTAGSPDIVSSIMGKIRIADIFICDLTIVKNDDNDGCGMPNSNVIFELGVAVALLGWERIICIVNTYYGDIELLPFDINHHRCLPYNKNGREEIKILDLSEPILKILLKYDQIVANFCKNDYIVHDKKIYEKLMESYSEEDLFNCMDACKISNKYNNYDYQLWNYFIHFQDYPKNRFIFEDLNTSYQTFTNSLDAMITDFISLFNPVDFGWKFEDPNRNYTQDEMDEILRTQRYKMRELDYPSSGSDEQIRAYYKNIEDDIEKISFHCKNVMNCFTAFRGAISRILFI